ncbi:Peptidoglycan/LPS O-acetylase OafA/YrhL, contains acyltransferase and SGNH-hydrolase domains [Paraburkholderia steynii]|uniref:Peptidoglycan/LPS O-acetylase OafA/YrhL, contains acyltransferase and SGNH-hydrolase domains n=1 Tax=Paraburkholderia steynii TaxID=1245441 RepID=A0A7Z7BIC0_9BURK|nr:Peptidoglycan/LPS O-acetylase OafA/YrhL, contains acyltransferase and SGNH-hydrolase domains [Paraburkholderia steynii]
MFGEFRVDVFFVLSGFVIALALEAGTTSVRDFVVSRLVRIVPLYWLATLLVFFGALLRPDLFNSTTANVPDLLKSLFFVPYRKESGHIFPMLFVGWTLNYEMLFYAASALALWRFQRHVSFVFAAITLLLSAVFLIASLAHSSRALVEFLAYDRLLEFPLGIAVWFVWRKGLRIPVALAASGAVAMYVLMTCIERVWPDVSPVVGNGVPTSLLLMSTLSLEGLVVDSALTRGLLYLGDASYATYLSHPFVIEAMRKLVPKVVHGFDVRSPGGVILAIVVASVVGCVVYRYVDKPLQRAMRRLINVKRVVNAPAGEQAPFRVR